MKKVPLMPLAWWYCRVRGGLKFYENRLGPRGRRRRLVGELWGRQ